MTTFFSRLRSGFPIVALLILLVTLLTTVDLPGGTATAQAPPVVATTLPVTGVVAATTGQSGGPISDFVHGRAGWLGPFAILVPFLLAGIHFRDQVIRGRQNREKREEEQWQRDLGARHDRPAWMASDPDTDRTVRPAWMSEEDTNTDSRPSWMRPESEVKS